MAEMKKENAATVVSKLTELRQEFNDAAETLSRANPIKAFFMGYSIKIEGLKRDADMVDKALTEFQSGNAFEKSFSKFRLASQREGFRLVANVYEDIAKSPARFILGKNPQKIAEAKKYIKKIGDILALM